MILAKQLEEITAKGRVILDPEAIAVDSANGSLAQQVSPHCIVKAMDTAEVQAIIKSANLTNTPIVPRSSGVPHLRGSAAPEIENAVVLDLSEMKRIIRVDAKNKVALIEPGVTFGELTLALEKEGLAPYLPLAPRATKSALASYLEREPITIPRDHWEMQDPLLCAEVVYGSGDLFRTGSAAGPGTLEEQWEVGRAQMRGLGPTQTDFAKLIQGAQGTMGVVTWTSVKCRRLPTASGTYFVPSDDIRPLVDLVYRVNWRRLGHQVFILNGYNLACLLASDPESIESLRAELPPWIAVFNVDGAGVLPEEKVEWMSSDFAQEAKGCGLDPTAQLCGLRAEELHLAISSPSPEPYWKHRHLGSAHDIFFMTTLDKTPAFIEQTETMAKNLRVKPADIGVYLQPTVQGTNCHCEFSFGYDPGDTKACETIASIDSAVTPKLAEMGGFLSRPYGAWAEVAYRRDPASAAALRKVKNVFDPNGVMNPGKLCL